MNRWGSVGISTFTFLGILLLLGAGVSSILLGQSTETSEEFEDVADEVLNEISTYFMIKNVVGKFDCTNSNAELQRMVILTKPLIPTTVNLSDMYVQISDGNALISLSYNGSYSKAHGDIFGNRIWNEIDENEFGIMILTDSDNSIDAGYLNKDLVYLAIKIPSSISVHPNDRIIVSLIPTQGYVENIEIITPFILTTNIVYLDYY
ncbi:MAG TPA: hypothetical protein ENI49_00380 [Thermoplasmatales archaeon]|nr:hypothetical protein [Thermoplasmatales archaeon]